MPFGLSEEARRLIRLSVCRDVELYPVRLPPPFRQEAGDEHCVEISYIFSPVGL